MSRIDLGGRVVLLSGASSGIGRAAALAFARRGARLALTARRAVELEETAAAARALGAEALSIPGDVGRREDCVAAVERTLAVYGSLDVLVNNAGINEYRLFSGQSLDSIESIHRINFLGTVFMTQAALPALKRSLGHVANVASIAGLMGVPGMAAYSASKFAVVGLTESLRIELRSTGVTLTAFCPGSTETPMAEAGMTGANIDRRLLKSAEAVAERLIRACEGREAEVVIGEIPRLLVRILRIFPKTLDWATWLAFDRARPGSLER